MFRTIVQTCTQKDCYLKMEDTEKISFIQEILQQNDSAN